MKILHKINKFKNKNKIMYYLICSLSFVMLLGIVLVATFYLINWRLAASKYVSSGMTNLSEEIFDKEKSEFKNFYTKEESESYRQSQYDEIDRELMNKYEYTDDSELNESGRNWFTFMSKIFKDSGWEEREIDDLEYKKSQVKSVVSTGTEIHYIGHSTFLLQADGINMLTDPIFVDRASPFQFAGPKRYVKPFLNIDELPNIDLVLLTHNHYDHMDIDSLRKLNERFPEMYIVTGLGNRKYLEDRGVTNVLEISWWTAMSIGNEKLKNIKITGVPAQHFSARSVLDMNRTIWLGFIVEGFGGKTFYYSGDTAFSKIFEDIANKYSKEIDYAFLPIGAYFPKNIFGNSHTSPLDVLKIAEILKVKEVIPMHFGTFPLALDSQDAPVEYMNALLETDKYNPTKTGVNVNMMKIGDKLGI